MTSFIDAETSPYFDLEILKRPQLRLNNYAGLRGPYFSMFQPPPWMNKNLRVGVVRAFKNPRYENDRAESNKMIQVAVDSFYEAVDYNGSRHRIYNASDFDTVINLPSQFSANTRICEYFNDFWPYKFPILDNVLSKKLSQEVQFDIKKILREDCTKTFSLVDDYINGFKNTYWNKPFEIKHIKPTLRRYVHNFLQLEPWCNKYLSQFIKGKNILLVDDTIGEGITLKEASDVLNQFSPRTITSFTVMRDYRRS